jgi:hypothetical protein
LLLLDFPEAVAAGTPDVSGREILKMQFDAAISHVADAAMRASDARSIVDATVPLCIRKCPHLQGDSAFDDGDMIPSDVLPPDLRAQIDIDPDANIDDQLTPVDDDLRHSGEEEASELKLTRHRDVAGEVAISRDDETGVEETVDEEELPPDWWMEALLADTCIEAAFEKAREITEEYNRRGESEGQDPDLVVRALNRWLHAELSQSLLVKLSAVGHLEMWNIPARKFVWAAPLLVLAQRVLCLPASEARSERTISQVRRILGRHAVRTSDETWLNRPRMTMCAAASRFSGS